MGRLGISCLFPASWHFSISPVGCPRILNTNLRQIVVVSILAAAVSLLYFSVVIIRNKYGRLSRDKKFQRYLARVTDIEATDTNNPNVNYGIVVDCGSSGSRIFVYCWPRHNGNPHDLLDIRQMRDKNRKPVVMKIKPGISEFATSPEKVSDYISPLLNFAAEHVPRAKHKETPLYILCTAGMRVLPESQQKAILEDLLTDIPVHFDFLFSDSHAEVISGKQEGWIMDFPGHFEQIFQQLNYQRLHGQLCDCVIVVGNRHFKAHRSVLAACSTHFRALFSVAEGDQTMNMIQLDSEVVTAEAFAALIDMMYTSTLMLGESNVMDVLLAASHLHLNSVVKACKHYLTTRTLPMSPPSERVQEQSARMQRFFMLQQLGLSIVSSALNSNQSGEEQPAPMSSSSMRNNLDQRTPFPMRRLHKRKQSAEERARQRLRPAMDESAISNVTPENGPSGVHPREEFFLPDSLKIVDNPKADGMTDNQEDGTVMFDQSFGAQEDAQVPSQSDNSAGNMAPLSMASRATQVETSFEPEAAAEKSGFQCENPELGLGEKEHMRVVVKSEPLSSPEPQDEVSDVTSQAEGSESVEVEGVVVSAEKIDLSPESSDRSFSDPQSSTDRVGDIHILEVTNNLDHKSTFSISNFLNKSRGSNFSANQNNDDNIPNTTSDCRLECEGPYLLSPETGPVGGPSSATGSHVENPFSEPADSHFARPMQEAMGLPCVQSSGYQGEQFGMDFSRSGLGLHSSFSRVMMGSSRGKASNFPYYRRIAPKMPIVTSVRSSQIPENSASSQLMMNGATSSFENGHPSQPGPPQLTRASADVLSKCKKALSEHNVLVVEGARKYACKICCKTFLTLTDCKKHIRVHTGEKPYACLKCGKRFSQSSHLYKHSKTTCLRWQSSGLPSTLL